MPIDDDAKFDAAAYHDLVVRPIRGRPRDLPPDLAVRYALPRDLDAGDLDPAQLAGHLRAVLDHWAERSTQQDYSGAVYVALLAAHEVLLADPDVDLTSPAWWAGYTPPEAPAEPARVLTGAAPSVGTGSAGPTGSPAPRTERPDRDRPHDLRAERTDAEVRLSWVWPSWATEALVCWEGHRRSVDREKFRLTGSWNTVLAAVHSDQDVSFTVAVRGVDADHRAWSAPVEVTVGPAALAVRYRVRRSWRHLGSRSYTVEFTTDRPPVRCDLAIGFSGARHLPESVEECTELGRAYLLSERTSELVTVGREHRSGWLLNYLGRLPFLGHLLPG